MAAKTKLEALRAGEAWAERQYADGVDHSWVARHQEARELGLTPEDDPKHELASYCAVAARRRFAELTGVPALVRPGNHTKSRGHGPSRTAPVDVRVGCSTEEKAAWLGKATSAGLTLSAWMRHLANREVGRE